MAEKVTGDQYYEIDGQLAEIKRQLRQSRGYPFNPENLKEHLQSAIEGNFSRRTLSFPPKTKFLKRVFCDRVFTVDSCDGSKTVFGNKGRDKLFVSCPGCPSHREQRAMATEETICVIYELKKSSEWFFSVGESLSRNWRQAFFTEHQLIYFVEKYFSDIGAMREHAGLFFLLKGAGKLILASVDRASEGLTFIGRDLEKHNAFPRYWWDVMKKTPPLLIFPEVVV